MPLAIDLFCGLGGWSEALLSEGWSVVGFDIERHEYALPELAADDSGGKGTKPVEKRGWTQGCAISLGLEGATARPRTRVARYPAQLVLQDARTLHGSQFARADLIVASPPCQEFSYMAMPWTLAKQKAAYIRARQTEWARLTELFWTCFRLQREASEAAGRYIPMVVENVKGAQPWVGRARANYGSFFLWGDVDSVGGRIVRPGRVEFGMPAVKAFRRGGKANPDGTKHGQGSWFAIADSKNRGAQKVSGFNFHQHEKTGQPGGSFQSAAVKNNGGGSWFPISHGVDNGQMYGTNPVRGDGVDGTKQAGMSGPVWFDEGAAKLSSRSSARKAASAQIAKIPYPLAQHIARVFKP